MAFAGGLFYDESQFFSHLYPGRWKDVCYRLVTISGLAYKGFDGKHRYLCFSLGFGVGCELTSISDDLFHYGVCFYWVVDFTVAAFVKNIRQAVTLGLFLRFNRSWTLDGLCADSSFILYVRKRFLSVESSGDSSLPHHGR